jgi:hypothetical protein
MKLTRIAALAATLLLARASLAADVPTGSSLTSRQINRDSGAVAAQAAAKNPAADKLESGRPLDGNSRDPGILERHRLLRAGITY